MSTQWLEKRKHLVTGFRPLMLPKKKKPPGAEYPAA